MISSPSGLLVLNESHCPATNPNRGTPCISNSRCLVSSESGTERVSFAVKVWNGIGCLDEITDDLDARGMGELPEMVWCCEQKQVLRLREFIRFANELTALRMTRCWCRKTRARSQ